MWRWMYSVHLCVSGRSVQRPDAPRGTSDWRTRRPKTTVLNCLYWLMQFAWRKSNAEFGSQLLNFALTLGVGWCKWTRLDVLGVERREPGRVRPWQPNRSHICLGTELKKVLRNMRDAFLKVCTFVSCWWDLIALALPCVAMEGTGRHCSYSCACSISCLESRVFLAVLKPAGSNCCGWVSCTIHQPKNIKRAYYPTWFSFSEMVESSFGNFLIVMLWFWESGCSTSVLTCGSSEIVVFGRAWRSELIPFT